MSAAEVAPHAPIPASRVAGEEIPMRLLPERGLPRLAMVGTGVLGVVASVVSAVALAVFL